MSKTVVVLNGNGTTSQTFGVFGGSLEQAEQKFLEICKAAVEDFQPKKVDRDKEGKIIYALYFDNEENWKILNAVTNETDCGGDPPNYYILKEVVIEEDGYQKTGAFND